MHSSRTVGMSSNRNGQKAKEVRRLARDGMPKKLIGAFLDIEINNYDIDVLKGAAQLWIDNADTFREKIVTNASFYKAWCDSLQLDVVEKEDLKGEILQIVRKAA